MEVEVPERSSTEYTSFEKYTSIFIQRKPWYGLKGSSWVTIKKDLEDDTILKHLSGEFTLGVLARWYPEYAILDIDGHHGRPKSQADVDNVRAFFGIDDDTRSMVYQTSPGSYHVLWKPQYNGKPATVNLLHTILDPLARGQQIELYPQSRRVIRAPLHPKCEMVTNLLPGGRLSTFDSLETIDIGKMAGAKRAVVAATKTRPVGLCATSRGAMREGMDLYYDGLQSPSSRYEAQNKVAMYLWRQNLTPDQALEELFHWITTKHNGFSADAAAILSGDYRTQQGVRREHQSIVEHIWKNFEAGFLYPDTTHNAHEGWFTRDDLVTAASFCQGDLSRFKFLAHLLAFFNPRKKTVYNIHTDHLTRWSSVKTYLKHIASLEAVGVLKRGKAYCVDSFSKTLTFTSSAMRPSFAPLSKGFSDGFGRALTFEETLSEMGWKAVYDLLVDVAGVSRQSAYQVVKTRGLKK